MDIGISGSTSSAEATAASNGGRAAGKPADTDQGGGFQQVLANAKGGDGESQPAGSPQSATDSPAPVNAGGNATRSIRSPHHAKPLIDIGQAGVKDQQLVHAGRDEADAEDGRHEIAEGRTAKASPRLPADAEKMPGAVRTKDIERIAKAATDADDTGDSANDDADDGSLSDVLTLLKGGEADHNSPPAAAAPAGHGMARNEVRHASTKPADGRVVGDVRLEGGDHSDQQGDASLPGTEVEDTTRTFRLSRADGRGKSMDMTIGAGKESAVEAEPRTQGAIENVSVLESRRFLGLAQNSNSASVAAAMAGDSEWANAMKPGSALSNAAAWTSTGKVVNTLKIQMNPIELGLVTATMRLHGDELSVDLKVENAAAYRQLRDDHGRMVEALRAQGYAVDNITVSIATVERPDAGAQSGAQGQSSQQQSPANQGQGGESQTRGQGRAEHRTSENDGLRSAGEGSVDEHVSGAAGRRSSGHVYL